MKRPLSLLLLCLFLTSSSALAQVIVTIPSPPVAGDPFELEIHGTWRDSCGPRAQSFFIDDRTILLMLDANPTGGCFPAVSPFGASFELPGLAAGTYSVVVRYTYGGDVRPFFESTIEVSGAASGIESIEPSFDGPHGGRVVVLRGGFPCSSEPCPVPLVYFGTVRSQSVEWISETEIHAVVPGQNHTGPIELSVVGPGYRYVRSSGFTYVKDGFEPVLVPVITTEPVAGAHGSLWQTELRMMSRGGLELRPGLDIFPLDPHCAPCLEPIPSGRITQPHFVAVPNAPPVRMFYVRKELRNSLGFNLRVRDLSRQSESWGTELPVVRSEDLSRTILLVNVPMQPGFRQRLRVYRPDGAAQATATFRSAAGGTLEVRTLTLARAELTTGGLVNPPYVRAGSLAFPLQPGFAELDLASLAELSGQDSISIEIQASGLSPIWAFVSLTNDATQQVTTVTPQ